MMAGVLDKYIRLQAPTITRDAYGAETKTWTDLGSLWAAIWDVSGREYFDADQIQAEVSHQIRIRYRLDVNPTRRFVYGNRIFEIQVVRNKNDHGEMLDCMSLERVTP